MTRHDAQEPRQEPRNGPVGTRVPPNGSQGRTEPLRLWHGGVPGLRVGDVLTGGNTRPLVDGCVFCEARAAGAAVADPAGEPIDPPSARPDRVYVTTDREYARYYASLWGRGDLYRVEPLDWSDLERSEEDDGAYPSWTVPAARVTAVYARAVTLTWSQRRALARRWGTADAAVLEHAGSHP